MFTKEAGVGTLKVIVKACSTWSWSQLWVPPSNETSPELLELEGAAPQALAGLDPSTWCACTHVIGNMKCFSTPEAKG